MEQQIITIANQLAAEGKQPTVALIKARLTSPVPMALLLSVLGRWKASPEKFRQQPPVNTEKQSPATALGQTTDDISELKQQLRQMQTQLDDMHQLLKTLVDKKG